MKTCSKCKTEKSIDKFYKNVCQKDGYDNWCKECKNILNKKYFSKNKQQQKTYAQRWRIRNRIKYNNAIRRYRKNNLPRIKIIAKRSYDKNGKQYYIKNQERLRKYHKAWNDKNRCSRLETHKKYYKKNRLKRISDQINRARIKYNNDPLFKIKIRVSSSIRDAVRRNRGFKKSSTWDKLPYTPQQLKEHLEKLWQPWMDWANYGQASLEKRTWQIDHIIPQSELPFDSLDHPNFLKCWSLDNLRPLESIANIMKGNRCEK